MCHRKFQDSYTSTVESQSCSLIGCASPSVLTKTTPSPRPKFHQNYGAVNYSFSESVALNSKVDFSNLMRKGD